MFPAASLLHASLPSPAELPSNSRADFNLQLVRWPVLGNPAPQLAQATSLWGEGLLLQPTSASSSLAVLLLDASQTPEQLLAVANSDEQNVQPTTQLEWQRQFVLELLRSGSTVLIPRCVRREPMQHGHITLSQREYLHRTAFELGSTLIGYEIQTVQAALDQFTHSRRMVCGFGEGGMLALYCGALDERVDVTLCCGYFGPREASWMEPLSRNVFGRLQQFGDAELGSMIAPRRLLISCQPEYQLTLATAGGAPAAWRSPERKQVIDEFARMQDFAEAQLQRSGDFATLVQEGHEAQALVRELLEAMGLPADFARQPATLPTMAMTAAEMVARESRLVAEIDAHTQALLDECDYRRQQFLNIGLERDNLPDGSNAVDASSAERYLESTRRFRQVFSEQIIGKFTEPLLPPAPRSARKYEGKNWTGYEVALDVFEDVFAYGILLLPNDLADGPPRPVVVCQHGLEGRPHDTIAGDHAAYHDFAAQLAERGFIVFAPQNPYIGQDEFRTLQRKLNPIGKTLFSVIEAQHRQLLNWLSSLPYVDSRADRILWAILRRKVSHAFTGPAAAILPIDMQC